MRTLNCASNKSSSGTRSRLCRILTQRLPSCGERSGPLSGHSLESSRWMRKRVLRVTWPLVQTPGKTRAMETDLVTVANDMPRSQFLHIAHKLTKDAGGSSGSMDLCAPPQVDDTPTQRCELARNLEQRPSVDPLVLDPVVTPSG